MDNILAAQILELHLDEITDGAYKNATKIAIESLYEDAVRDWNEHYSDQLSLIEYLGMTEEKYNVWIKKKRNLMEEKYMVVSVLYFDKDNKQIDYQFIARDMDGEIKIGWIVIEKPWYSIESNWTYWMYTNKYGQGICGGASDLGFERTMINPETIRPFNQIEEIKYHLEMGSIVKLKRKFCTFDDEASSDNILAVINSIDEIPYDLWA